MDRSTVERQKLLEAVSTLPEEALLELASFLDYLRYKSAQRREVNNHCANFLVAVAGLGNSGQQDISERDEEILCNEIDPVYGYSTIKNTFCRNFSLAQRPRTWNRRRMIPLPSASSRDQPS